MKGSFPQTEGDANLRQVAFVDNKVGIGSLVFPLAGSRLANGKKFILAHPSKQWFERLREVIGAERIQWIQGVWDRISPILRAMAAVNIAA